ncbi:hypothetical protein [Antarctobacter sp.]|uniref:hypothetical protein n=1 Tax=Antarctobacter sp. TaxID=1872577 RepID=UPI002B265A89|nr:hypothetical protein [Antarctobacter sp.]
MPTFPSTIRPRLWPLFVSALTLLAPPAAAAEFEVLNAHPEGCNVMVSGQIRDGDRDRLAQVIPRSDDLFDHTGSPITLCLNSPGGSLLEGLEIAAYLRGTGIRSHVAADHNCLSACALAFLGGTQFSVEDGLIPNRGRSIHARAVLGFHRPQLDTSSRQFSDALIHSAFDTAVRATALIFASLDDLRITRKFALSFFDVEDGGFYYIDTGFRVHELGVDVTGLGPLPARIPDETVRRICQTTYPDINPARYADGYGVFQFQKDWTIDLPTGDGTVQTTAYVVLTTGEGTLSYDACLLKWDANDAIGYPPPLSVQYLPDMGSDLGNYSNPQPPSADHLRSMAEKDPWAWQGLPPVLASPPDSPLAHLAGPASNLTFNRDPGHACAPLVAGYKVAYVTAFSNLRASPGFDKPVVLEVPKGTRVLPVDHSLSATVVLSDACSQTCNPAKAGYLAPDLSDRVRQCSFTNMIWWLVRTPEGVTGWMSRRFLTAAP